MMEVGGLREVAAVVRQNVTFLLELKVDKFLAAIQVDQVVTRFLVQSQKAVPSGLLREVPVTVSVLAVKFAGNQGMDPGVLQAGPVAAVCALASKSQTDKIY